MLAEVAGEDGRVLAGGQSLVPTMAFRLAKPAHLVDINGVAGAQSARGRRRQARHRRLRAPCGVPSAGLRGPLGKLLADVVRHIAHYPIRNRGTFCGSLAHADPASEWCLVLVALDGEVLAKSARGERVIAARDFFKGIMTTALARRRAAGRGAAAAAAAGHALRLLRIQPPRRRFRHGRGARRLSRRRRQDRRAARSRSAAPRSIRGASPRPSARSAGATPGDAAFRAAAEAATAAIDPMEDNVTTAEFRRDLVLAVTRRALERAAQS